MAEPPNAFTDPDSGLRFYQWGKEKYLSVTSVRRLVGMAHPLHQYALTKVIERAINERAEVDAILARDRKPRERNLEANVLAEAMSFMRAAATIERDQAGERGTAVHEAVDAGISPDDIEDEEIRSYVTQFYGFVKQTGAQTLASERQVFHSLGYAGSFDRIFLHRGRRLMTDIKTSKGIYLDHAVQLVAYSMAQWVGENDVVDNAMTELLRNLDGMAILHLGPTSWELVEIAPTPELWAAFVGSLTFALFLHRNNESIEGLITESISGSA